MKQPIFKVTCEICGEEGVGNINTAAAEWISSQQVTHSDPTHCRRNLDRRAQILAEKEKANGES